MRYIHGRILECDANVGDKKVKLQLITPPGKDIDTVLDQLSALEVNLKRFFCRPMLVDFLRELSVRLIGDSARASEFWNNVRLRNLNICKDNYC